MAISTAVAPTKTMYDLGSVPRIDYIYRNWAGTYFCKPKFYFEPETTDQILEIYQLARLHKTTVKFIGSSASPSTLPCTEGLMVCMRRFNQIIKIDKNKLQVEAQGGILLADLQEILANNGLAIPTLPSVNFITLAGAISTATHGNGINHGNLSSNIVSMDVLTTKGEMMRLDGDNNLELFLAAKVSLGLVGAIINVTIRVEPSFNVVERRYSCDLDHVVRNIDKIVRASEFSKVMFYPHTDRCVVFEMDRTTAAPTNSWNPISRSYQWIMNELVGKHLFYYALKTSYYFPKITKLVNNVFYYALHHWSSERVDRSDRIFNFEVYFPQYVGEVTFKVEDTAPVLTEFREMIQLNNLDVHFPIEIRFVKGDDAYLSHNNGYDCMMINLLSFRPGDCHFSKEKYFALFDEKIRKKFNGRSHWAKTHTDTPQTLRELYPQFDRFMAARKIMDPDGLLLNRYARIHLLGETPINRPFYP